MRFSLKNAILVLILVLSVFVMGCTDNPDSQETALEKAPLSTQSIKDAVAKDDSVVVLFFWYSAGAPCIQQNSILNNIQTIYGDKITIVPLEVRDFTAQNAWNDYSHLVRGPPTTIIVTDDGYITTRFMGVAGEQTLIEAIDSAAAM
ncbi:MAG: hypothetical protein P1P69_07080 [Methanosarcinaceae archaeon]|nr:hypothetical protein [Methanosarcinaceae archaeon]MDF1534250.1 hypothetical protein [Methanosarcinaceae archaeon]